VMGSSMVVTSAPAPLHFIPVTFSLEIFSPTPKLPGMLLLLYLYVVSYHYHTFLVCWSWCNDAMHYSLLKENFDIFLLNLWPTWTVKGSFFTFLFSALWLWYLHSTNTYTYLLSYIGHQTDRHWLCADYVRIGQNVAEISWLANTHTHTHTPI